MRVLVCGSRTWTDWRPIHAMLNGISWAATTPDDNGQEDDLLLILGGAKGADELASVWGDIDDEGIRVETYPADWEKFGKAAGPIRNQQMLEDGNPDLVVAFSEQPVTGGTADMIAKAKAAGVPVWVVSHG